MNNMFSIQIESLDELKGAVKKFLEQFEKPQRAQRHAE